MERITIKEIAKRAGVSVGTVDRVLHNRGEVAETTKELVLEIARKGNYTTNVFARNLKLNKIYNLAIILPNDNEYWIKLNDGIKSTASEYESLGIRPKFYSFDRNNSGSFIKQSHQALESSPDGVVLAPLLEKEASEICQSFNLQRVPFIFVDSNLEGTNPLAFIGQDSKQSGYLAASLLNMGFKKGARSLILKYTDFDSVNKTIDERIEGFKKYYRNHSFHQGLIEEMKVEKAGLEIGIKIDELIKNDEPIHVLIPNSRAHQFAKETERYLKDGQFRIVGYDLIEKNCEYLNKGLIDFIIYQNPQMQGKLSIQLFYKHLILKSKVSIMNYMPLDVVTKENLEYSK